MRFTALGLIACLGVFGQNAFEVASVKAAKQPINFVRSNGGPGTDDPGLYNCENCSLNVLISYAFGVEYFRVIDPGWMQQTAFVINARVPARTTKEQFREMLQNLLAERFHLAVHREKREMTAYELLVGKGGPKLKPAEEEAAQDGSKKAGTPESKLGTDGYPTLPDGYQMSWISDRARMRYPRQTMKQFVGLLEGQLGGPVVDSTGLTGKYDIELYWASDDFSSDRAGASEPRPNLVQALQQQLGLRLVKKREPIEVIVVDRCERVPTEN
ncbi:MAG TPA: TIGR03435 family protein [Bryobacteraceae bacterium]|nr:TIGR03435 family protein [Bryobacteraceae bacterium]